MTETDKPIPAIYSAGAIMVALLLYTRSLGFAAGCALFSLFLFYGQNQPKVKDDKGI